MLINLIKKARRQPKPVRDKIAMTIAGVFTFGIFVFWVVNFPARNMAIMEQKTGDNSSIFANLFNQIGGQVSNIKESINASSTATSTKEEAEDVMVSDYLATTTIDASVYNTDEASTTVNTGTSTVVVPVIPEPSREIRITTVSNSSSTLTSTSTY